MLSTLTIRDVVLIDRLELEFRPGLCALTGETGAGKSILLDALGLTLGSRADARLVRHGAEQAMVTAGFAVAADHPVRSILAGHGFAEGEEEVVLRRVIGTDGRSRAFVNDQPVSVGLLRGIGDTLVEIHGQFESQRLLDPAVHRDLLDAFGRLLALREATAGAWRVWREAADARSRAEADLAVARRDEAFLRHAVGELETLDPRQGEEADLAQRRAMLMGGAKLMQALDEATRELAGGGGSGVEGALHAAIRILERAADKAEGRLDGAVSSLRRALSEAVEGQALMEKAVADLDLDPRRLEEIEERLFALRALARKHGCGADDLAGLRATLAARLAMVDDGAERLDGFARAERAARERYREAAERLGEARRRAAADLDAAVAVELEPLRLGRARFVTTVESLAERDWGEHGCDRVVFEVATNPGVPPGPLARIASGGELARFMLALKVVLARADPVPTLIFDEVDAGIGGAVAAAVGDRLARLADQVQVLVLTHSPQVAARGGHHWRVSKTIGPGGARTTVEVLDEAERREEIARMLAGTEITREARAAAESLLLGGAA
ncbi:MAG: DNA repair protein RecN [Rhodospirillales bacterium]